MNLFYVPNLATVNVLSEEESGHAVRVLRLAAGAVIDVTDGRGLLCKARISLPHPKHCAFDIVEQNIVPPPRPYKLQLAVAPTKNIDRFEWLVEKATEIGVDTITPIICRFSERKILKPERLEKIIVAAAKQSLNVHFPVLQEFTSFDKFLATAAASQSFIAHCYETETAKPLLKNCCQPRTDTLIMIGPEGDFSREEVLQAEKLDFVAVSLGSSRLRTETAGIVACDTVSFVNQ
ncbi:MAG: 16S rRNA (uracil(1498)-N(3))-methyltransferase [Prevotellaceae bacterium]|jgi:16S rRNA (uracil1498-N3)-methyltransferase|nr:16S rRNA (uracil(1498)-N(3))-methyltransferase [Prevotellaceae bacterium]